MRVSHTEFAGRNYSGGLNSEEDDRERRLILPEAVPRKVLKPT
jgi:hypothetical protein